MKDAALIISQLFFYRFAEMSDLQAQEPGKWYIRLFYYIWYDFICISHVLVTLLWKDFRVAAPVPKIDELEKRTDQVAVMIGGPRGLGLGMIKRLVQLDYTIIMGVRNIPDSEARLNKFAESNLHLDFGKVSYLEMDLMSLSSVKNFGEKLLTQTSRIDLLLCNAGVLLTPYELTEDGYERKFQVNYLGHFLVIQLLLQKIKQTAAMKGHPCQIIYSASCIYNWAHFNPNELEKPTVHTPAKCYIPSKLYSIMSMLYMQRKLKAENAKVNIYAVHPGVIKTDLVHQTSRWIQFAVNLIQGILRTKQEGADTILWPVLSPEFFDKGGLYMESGRIVELKRDCFGNDNLDILYKKSLSLAGLDSQL